MGRFIKDQHFLNYLIIFPMIAITAICIISLLILKYQYNLDPVCSFKIVERNGKLVPLELNSPDDSEPIGHFKRLDDRIGLFLDSKEVRDVTKCFQDYRSQISKIDPYE